MRKLFLTRTPPGLKTGKHGIVERRACSPAGTSLSGAATVISAMVQAKEAARAIDEYIRNKA